MSSFFNSPLPFLPLQFYDYPYFLSRYLSQQNKLTYSTLFHLYGDLTKM